MMGEFFTPGDLLEMRSVADAVEESLQFLTYTNHNIFQIKLALEEALVNAIRHGNRMNLGKHVRVVFRAAADRFDVCITDQGDGFTPAGPPSPTDPVTEEAPGGRGPLLVNTFMTEVRVCGRGNVVAMAWTRPVGR